MGVVPRIGLLGGSFDPVHRAHVALARAALDALALDRVELIPAHRPWQRGTLGAEPAHRLRMLEIACQGDPRLSANPVELQRSGPTYTIDTLEGLPPQAQYTWILGADQLTNFCTWHRWQDIIERVHLAVAQRPGADDTPPPELAEALAEGQGELLRIPFVRLAISATDIRHALRTGLPVDDMLDPNVLEYIRTHHLYSDPAASLDPKHSL
ncbi:nicotinate (nicotinamide) nucleotide adenylyltransferase [Castellaniella sp. GW247-6E4]|uniref:nicotinate (nicotinamide) nucleotide adenylyltransferase n=1 Tax=Castellaniella sp. GW247-6E4 TaxID=3140380 RepID=UPI0033159488